MPTRVVSRMEARRAASSSEVEFEVLDVWREVPAVATFLRRILYSGGSLLRRYSRRVRTHG